MTAVLAGASIEVQVPDCQASDAKCLTKHLELTTPSRYAECPSCGYEMTVTAVSPTFLREGWEDISFACKRCGTQSRRRVKSS
jgi:DNA-directed RNA polymerase subunit RPC12/RpoP